MAQSQIDGIWIYFNKKGGSAAKINHGNIIRQGGTFKLVFAFEDDNMILDKNLYVSFKTPGAKETSEFHPVTNIYKSNVFHKEGKEMTFGLVDGKEYYCLMFECDNFYTKNYGNLILTTKIADSIDSDTPYYQGNVQLYIEPTYGKQIESTNISVSQYEMLNDNKVNKTGDTLTGTFYAASPETTINVRNPSEAENVANKGYVDRQFREIVGDLSSDQTFGVDENDSISSAINKIANKALVSADLDSYVKVGELEDNEYEGLVIVEASENYIVNRREDGTFETKNIKNEFDNCVTIGTEQTISGYKKYDSIGVDTINGSTLGNAILRQDKTSGNVIIGSNLRPLRLTTSETRPKVAVNGNDPLTEDSYVNLALSSDIPTKVSQLTNDNNYATENYVNTNGGKIDKIKINGIEQTISSIDKSVNLDLSNYATKSDISSVYRVKGTKTWSELIAITDAQVGDVYNVSDKNGANYVCVVANTAGESSWNKLGETVDLSGYYTKTESDGKYISSVTATIPGIIANNGSKMTTVKFFKNETEEETIEVFKYGYAGYFPSGGPISTNPEEGYLPGLMTATDKAKLDLIPILSPLENTEIDEIFNN